MAAGGIPGNCGDAAMSHVVAIQAEKMSIASCSMRTDFIAMAPSGMFEITLYSGSTGQFDRNNSNCTGRDCSRSGSRLHENSNLPCDH